MTWSLIVDDTFSRANTSPGSAGSTSGAGNGWIDAYGGVWQIAADQLKSTCDSVDSNEWARDFLLRPTSENQRDSRIVFTVPGSAMTPNATSTWGLLRYNNSGTATFYLIQWEYGSSSQGKIALYAVSGTTPTQIGATQSFSITGEHNFSIDFSAVNANPTTLSVTVTDLNTSSVVYTNSGSQTDSTSALQVSGQAGLTASNAVGGTVAYYSEVATYKQTLASLSISPTSVTAGSTGNITLTGTGTSWASGTPGSPTFTASSGTINSQTVASGTSASINITAPGSAGAVTITDPSTSQTATLTINAAPASEFALSPSSQVATVGSPSGNYTVTPNGTPSSSTAVALSDGGAGGTFTPSSLTLTTSTAQTFTYTPASTGIKTLTATASGGFSATHTASCVASTGPVTLAVTDSNWFWSPYGWYLSGATYAAALAPGCYFKIGFSGTSAALKIQTSQLSEISSSQWPKIRWSIDGGAYQTAQLSGTAISLATGLASGNHTLWLQLTSTQGGSGWSSLTNVLWVTGLQIDGGATSVAPSLNRKRTLIYGDSITQGVVSTGINNEGVVGDDALLSWAADLGFALDSEYGQIGYTGLGWTVAAAGGAGAPALFTPGNELSSSWDKIWGGASRLVSGSFSPPPDYLFVLLGRNDYNQTGSAVTVAVSGFLTAVRAAAGSAAWTFIIIPFDGSCRSVITAGFNNYQAASPDSKCKLLDLSTDSLFNLTLSTGSTTATAGSIDGTHPDYQLHGALATQVAKLVQAALGASGTTTTSGYSRSRVSNQ